MELAMEDIFHELDAIEEHLSVTGRTLKRFRVTDNTPPPREDEEEDLPWN
jgi:hypothetical protein